MLEPVDVQNIMLATAAGALVVLTGAMYALLFALGRLKSSRLLSVSAYVAYALLAASVLVLASALNLGGFWQIIVAVMLVGYLLAPQAIWHLCVGTHRSSVEGRVEE